VSTDVAGRELPDFGRARALFVAATVFALFAVIGLGELYPDSVVGTVYGILRQEDTLSAALRLAVPISLAAVGGIFAERSGVINIGLEGLLIISAFTSVLVAETLGAGSVLAVPNVWVGFAGGVLASVLLSVLFAVVCIEFKADQIIAGLAVWLIALGLAPFASKVIYGSVNSASVETIDEITIPVLELVPVLGFVFRETNPVVFIMLLSVPVAWWLLNRTAFGRWIEASGENPKALDTAGVSVRRVRYAAVTLSGVFSGLGGAALALGEVGSFVGNGQTMINGRGFIAITAYLFGNYNPVGAFGASLLFSGLDAIQIRLQQAGIGVPDTLVSVIPYVTVIVVLALVGRTRIPEAAGEHYEADED